MGGGRKNKNRAGETERKNFVHQKCLKEKNSGETFQKQFVQGIIFPPLTKHVQWRKMSRQVIHIINTRVCLYYS